MEFQTKWHNELNLNLDYTSWQYIFKLCFKTSGDAYHRWFQYRILHRILANQHLLNKMGMSNSSTCLSCQSDTESLSHLFYFCPNAKYLWKLLETKIKNSTNFSVSFTPMDTILGYTLNNNNASAINVILLVTKIYIYKNSRKLKKYCIEDVVNLIEKTYTEQRLVAKLDLMEQKFDQVWHQMKYIFL